MGTMARSAWRPFVCLSRPPRRSHQVSVARWPGNVSVRQTARTWSVSVAFDGRRNGDNLAGAIGLSARGHRLADAAENLASDGGWLRIFAYKSARLCFPSDVTDRFDSL